MPIIFRRFRFKEKDSFKRETSDFGLVASFFGEISSLYPVSNFDIGKVIARYRTMLIYAILLMLLYLLNTITIESICDIMKNKLVRSTLILSIATLTSKVLGSIFRIPLQNIAGDEVLGIFSLVYPVYMVALNLSVAGIPVAISKLISEATVSGDKREIRKIYTTAVILALLLESLVFFLS